MIKKILTSSIFLAFSALSLAQLGGASNSIPKIIPPSPNAAALEKFGTIPVDYSTGVPSISYPMWSWNRGKLSFNIGLSYHAGGHKVDDMAPSTGLGWALSGIGRVSRTVRGLPDDAPVRGFMNSPLLPEAVANNYDGTKFYFTPSWLAVGVILDIYDPSTYYSSINSGTDYTIIKDIATGNLDGEQDVFSYSFNGGSGRFIIDKEKNIIPLEQTNSKIEMALSSSGITSFKITDDKGIVYKYEYQETSNPSSVSIPASLPTGPVLSYNSGWLLTKIIDPATHDSIVISYITSEQPTGYETGFSESDSWHLETADYTAGQNNPGIGPNGSTFSFSNIGGYEIYASSVTFPDGSLLNLAYNFNRADLVNGKALTGLLVKNNQDAIIKDLRLNYSYFSSGTGFYAPVFSSSGNDFNKRLRLDGIDELSADGAETKSTTYTYNATALNIRSSKNIDFWGYNVNPERNNLYYVPEVPLDEEEAGTQFGAYLGGADRRPDETFMKAGVLEKITYPTGGYTTFGYEANRAFSAVDYYVDRLHGNGLEWEQNVFNTALAVSFPGRSKEEVEFIFQVEEPGVRPEPDPSSIQLCLAESQDGQPAAFEVTSTDGSFTTKVEDTYSRFLGNGKKVVLSLPLGKSYQVKFIYDASAQCAYIYPFTANTQSTYFIAPEDKLVGGLRIKKITSHDGLGGQLIKEYDYNKANGRSSATLNTIPDFGYHRTTVDATLGTPGGGTSSYVALLRNINRSSNPTNTLSYFNGGPLIYTQVKEKERDGSCTERYYDPIVSASNGGTGFYPYLPSQDFTNQSGLLTKQIIKDKNGVVKTEEVMSYNKPSVYLLNQPNNRRNRNVKTGAIATASNYNEVCYVADSYFMYITHAEPTSKTTTVHENGNTLTQTVNYTYDPSKNYLRSEQTVNSKNEQRTKNIFYAFDDLLSPAYNTMLQGNMLNYVTGAVTRKSHGPAGILTQSKTNYQLWQNNTLPMPSSVQSNLYNNTPETEVTFDAYDDKGNVLQYTGKDGLVTSFVWGYNQQYPVAKIVGKTHADVMAQSNVDMNVINNPASDAALRTELNKINALQGCIANTITYKPLVGATSETDVNGKTIYYEYDAFNRLKLVRDQDGNIVKKMEYKYNQ